MITRGGSLIVALLAVIACGGSRASSDETVKPARMAPPDPVVTCAEWVRRAVADPEIGVDRVPEPVSLTPAPLPRRLPKGVLDKHGKGEVRIRVLIDTLGAATMSTFAVVKSSHPTLTNSVKAAVAKWKFTSAEIGGCKVPRHFNWGVVLDNTKNGHGSR